MTASALPANVIESDTQHPAEGRHLSYSVQKEMGLEQMGTRLTFYRTERFGWVLTTLLIGKAELSAASASRTATTASQRTARRLLFASAKARTSRIRSR